MYETICILSMVGSGLAASRGNFNLAGVGFTVVITILCAAMGGAI